MRHQVWIRPYDDTVEAEAKAFVTWLYEQRELNKFDPELLRRKQAKIYTLFDDSGIVGFQVISIAFMMEYITFRPELEDVVKARALETVQQFIVGKAGDQTVPNALFRPSDERYAEFAKKYGWKKDDELYVLHFADLEKKSCPPSI